MAPPAIVAAGSGAGRAAASSPSGAHARLRLQLQLKQEAVPHLTQRTVKLSSHRFNNVA